MLTAKLTINGKDVGLVEIVNVTRGAGRVSADYYWRIQVKKISGEKKTTVGLTVDSCNGDAMDLLAEVLTQYAKNSPAFDNHGNKVSVAEGITLTPEEYWAKYGLKKQSTL